MIFHTSADIKCYNLWFDMFYDSVKEHCPLAKSSFNFVGEESIQPKNLDIFTQEKITFNQIKEQYQSIDDKSAKGYYCISRFLSIPCMEDHVLLCDIDLKLIKTFDIDIIENILKEYQAINFCRLKLNGRLGGMMAMLLREDICESVKAFANKQIKEQPLNWGLDSLVRSYIYQNYSVKNEMSLYNIAQSQNLSAKECLFAYHKKTGNNRHENKDKELKSFKIL